MLSSGFTALRRVQTTTPPSLLHYTLNCLLHIYTALNEETLDLMHSPLRNFHRSKDVFRQFRAGKKVTQEDKARQKELDAESGEEFEIDEVQNCCPPRAQTQGMERLRTPRSNRNLATSTFRKSIRCFISGSRSNTIDV